MVEGFIGQLVAWAFAQGGGYVLSVFLIIVIWMQDKRKQKADADAETAVKEANAEIRSMYEKRINEFRELLDVMAGSTNTVSAMHSSLTASTEAINQLAAGFATLMQEFHAQQARWDDRRGAMAEQLKDIQQRIEDLQRRAGRAA